MGHEFHSICLIVVKSLLTWVCRTAILWVCVGTWPLIFVGIENSQEEVFFWFNFFNAQVFQCLLIEGENCGKDALREAEKFVISNEDFNRFIEKHSKLACLVPESNEKVSSRSMEMNQKAGDLFLSFFFLSFCLPFFLPLISFFLSFFS